MICWLVLVFEERVILGSSSHLSKISFTQYWMRSGDFWPFFAFSLVFPFPFGQALFVLLLCIADDTPRRTTGWNGVLDTMMRVFGDIRRLGISLICA
jgi:hypothetical protein